MPETVFVAMSGGVDSSAAALLLLEQGYRVVGVTLRLYDSCGAPASRGCCALEDAADARAVAKALGIEHRLLEYQVPFEREVIEPFVAAYAAGRTPNPCIACNEKVKFGALWAYTLANGGDRLATGHHARLVEAGGRVDLRRAVDREKDQSYVLFPLTLDQRRRVLFPVGEMGKEALRAKARSAGLPTADKRESQDICFVGDGRYADFVEKRLPVVRSGMVRHVDGRVLGSHGGVHRFTVGQRQGLGIPFTEPLYVISVEAGRAEVLVGPKSALDAPAFLVEGWNWHFPEEDRPAEVAVQVRYHQEPRSATLIEGPGGLVVTWAALPQCVTPGQAAVAYSDDTVVGGGWIVGRRE
jgi:tRNA-uridine 2-sulfurtransferase